MIDYQPFYQSLKGGPLASWLATLPKQVEQALSPETHGDLPRWLSVLEQLPGIPASHLDLNSDCLKIGGADDCDADTRARLEELLQQLHPWRKGPYCLHGIHIDTEWRSDWKWQRLEKHISPLAGRRVLDVGCGNGYHCWRMAGAGAAQVIGIDPTLLFVMQFWALKHFIGEAPVHVLPLGVEALPANLAAFDTVFSMGVLYHRKDPHEHLGQLFELLRPGGELVLETLVIEGQQGELLVPEGRYAKMRNVWALPTCLTLEAWLQENGYQHIRQVDVTTTSTDEQRATPWMRFESLPDYLHPADLSKTIEGHPAPRRAILIAQRP